jgi:hypothetical protein
MALGGAKANVHTMHEARRALQQVRHDLRKITHGTATLENGTVTVTNSDVQTGSIIQLTSQSDGGTPGWLRVSARVAGTSFTITSSSNIDTSSVGWLMIQP